MPRMGTLNGSRIRPLPMRGMYGKKASPVIR
nr:MAG TPA: hypothetical protein [Caudoviricetes sp.]